MTKEKEEGALDKGQKFSVRDLLYLAGIVVSGIIFYYQGQNAIDEKIAKIETRIEVIETKHSETLDKVKKLTEKLDENNKQINRLVILFSAKFGIPIE
jgi:uncharacterized protein YoxC